MALMSDGLYSLLGAFCFGFLVFLLGCLWLLASRFPDHRTRGVEWACHICGKLRPDAKIAVWSRSTPMPAAEGYYIVENIRYCKDRVKCWLGVPDFSFLKRSVEIE